MKRQILFIHGGSSFDSYERYLNYLKMSSLDYERLLYGPSWQDWIATRVGSKADILSPSFPNKFNAVFDEWMVYFEKILPHLTEQVSLVGHSLGAMFLVKYLHHHPLAKPVEQLILLAPCYDDDSQEDLGSFAISSAKELEKSAKEIHLLHSKDDPVVPFNELSKFRNDLPSAKVHIFEDKNHFFDPEFPELLDILGFES